VRRAGGGVAVAALLFGATATTGAGCDRLKGQKPADIAPLAAEDAELKKSQDDLVIERGALQRERKRLLDARAEIVDRRKQLGHDSVGQAALDEEDKKLVDDEKKLEQREAELAAKLDKLLEQRGELVKKATTVVATAPGADPLERAAKRESSVAEREKAIAQRERELAQREKELAEREARQAKRERDVCGGTTVVQAPATELPKGLKYAAKDVEPTYKKALKLMQERGILDADLPPGAQRLVEETREAMRKADYVRAKYDAESLLAAVEDIKIDRNFISAKMARLSAAMRGKKLEGEPRKTVEQLFQQATANYGDGKFPQANAQINRLFSMLK
jgi:hypothetical protein